jgi:hypothetical protein
MFTEMNWKILFEIAGAALAAIGSASVLLFALSRWLGKVWASRILEKERTELVIFKETVLKERNEKVATYKTVVDVVSKILADLDKWYAGHLAPEKGVEAFHLFNEQRMRAYGYLGMVAPQSVMDAQDKLIDHIMLITTGRVPYKWEEVRSHALGLINEIRKDIAIDKSPISHNGML